MATTTVSKTVNLGSNPSAPAMTLTTAVRINWPVPYEKLLDHMTTVVGGDPKTAIRSKGDGYLRNQAGQGFNSSLWIDWWEDGIVNTTCRYCDDCSNPPAMVSLSFDNSYGSGSTGENNGRWFQAHVLLPELVKWLDTYQAPRDRWWFHNENYDVWHPGTEPVQNLFDKKPHEMESWITP